MTTRIPITCEARLMGLSKQRRKDGDWTEIKFHIHPDDFPQALFILPLGTDCELSIQGVVEDGKPDETGPEPTPAPLKGGRRAKMAGILCNDQRFHWFIKTWIADNTYDSAVIHPDPAMSDVEKAAYYVRWACDIESRAELDHDEIGGQIWDGIESDYRASQRGETEEDRQRQLQEGPM